MLLQLLRHVVGVEDRDLGCARQARAAHQRDVDPGDRQDAGAAVGRGADRADGLFAGDVGFDHRMSGKKRRELWRDADRPHARPAAAVGDAEGFVQVEMADIRADVAGAAEADLRVHVRAVHVNLSAVLVDDLADFLDALFEHAVRARIGDHQAGELVAMLLGFGFQIGEVDVALRIGLTATTLKPAMTALAGLVPWALVGIRQTLRCASPRDS